MNTKTSKLTYEEAVRLLNTSDERVHTFRNLTGMVLGCDWDMPDLLKSMLDNENTLELTGETARRMGHGICLNDGRHLFIETNKEAIDLFDPQ